MKLYFSILASAILLSTITIKAGNTNKINEYVQVSISTDKKIFKADTFGEIIIKFQPKDGIHINLDPPFSINLDSTAVIKASGKPFFKKDNKTQYLDVSKPVKQKFSIPKNIKPGEHKIKGMLIYFYCSNAEGWCSRFKQPFELDIRIK